LSGQHYFFPVWVLQFSSFGCGGFVKRTSEPNPHWGSRCPCRSRNPKAKRAAGAARPGFAAFTF
jgi:hypothetical protein